MNKFLHPAVSILVISGVAVFLSACGTPPAKDFGGRWKPVNKYDDKVVEIPLAVPYTYYAAPMDGTLKVMLTRWTTDTGLKLNYKLRSDFTLPKTTSDIHTTELRDAANQLSAIYAPQGIVLVVSGSDLIVEEASAILPSAPAPSSAASGNTATASPSSPSTGNSPAMK